jgi:prepilin signal peptidase PulO-like enzyme (type II secretory pathway)
MIIFILVVLGLCLGSFVNALIWRLHEQENIETESKSTNTASAVRTSKKVSSAQISQKDLSIMHGRSMCPNCKHQLSSLDLIPVRSWVYLRGQCRYCKQPISWQYPIVELITAALFIVSYLAWPYVVAGTQVPLFILWLALLVGLMALIIYDLRWLLLPNRIIYPLSVIALAYALVSIVSSSHLVSSIVNELFAVIVGGGIFYVLFQVSGGKWIGGGDVRLGWLLGLIAGTPTRSILFIFIASLIGSLVSIPLIASRRLKRTSIIPFGPFLITGLIITHLFGAHIINWYQNTLFKIH